MRLPTATVLGGYWPVMGASIVIHASGRAWTPLRRSARTIYCGHDFASRQPMSRLQVADRVRLKSSARRTASAISRIDFRR